MERSRFTEDQIIGILKEHEAGVSVADLCRKHGVSDATVYKWKARYGGMDVSEAKRLKGLEDENSRPKRLLADATLADATLDNAARQDLLGKSGDARRKVASGRASCGNPWDERCRCPAGDCEAICREGAGVPGARLLPDDHAP